MKSLHQENIQNKIYTVRNLQVMLDSDLAILFETETKFINRSVKRNISRFPEDFACQITIEEWDIIRYQNGTLKNGSGRGQHRKYLPWVFTEQGVAMLSAVLNTNQAVFASIQIMHAFVSMRNILMNNAHVIDNSHDRFLIIDKAVVYHIGASLKDLGKKWFAFSKMDKLSLSTILNAVPE